MKVKGTNEFSYYRLMCIDGLSYDNFRALQQGEVVDIDKKVYEANKNIFELVEKPPKKKEVKDGN